MRESSWGWCRCEACHSLAGAVARRPAGAESAASGAAVAVAGAAEDAVAGETWAAGRAGCRPSGGLFDCTVGSGSITTHRQNLLYCWLWKYNNTQTEVIVLLALEV